MQATTKEQFDAAFTDMNNDEIRAELARDHALTLPRNLSRAKLLDQAYAALCAGETPPSGPAAPRGRGFQIRCTGVETRFRAGHLWTSGWETVEESEYTPEQWKELRADRRIMIREIP